MKVFAIVGIVFLVLGVFFGFQALQPAASGGDGSDPGNAAFPILAITFLPIGVIFTVIGIYFTRLSSAREQLMQTGIVGTATIQSVADTGVYVNDQPMAKLHLTISLPGRAPYTVQHSEMIPLTALGRLAPGNVLPVAVDPADSNKVAVDWSGDTQARAIGAAALGATPTSPMNPGMAVPNTLSTMTPGAAPNTLSGTPAIGATPIGLAGMAGGMQGPGSITIGGQTLDLSAIYRQLAAAGVTITGGLPQMISGTPTVIDARPGDAEAHLAQLKASGNAGRAAVTAAQDMGVAIHGNQLMTLELNVTAGGGAPYPVRVTALVPPASAARAVAGASLPVYVDSVNPGNLAIDWDAST